MAKSALCSLRALSQARFVPGCTPCSLPCEEVHLFAGQAVLRVPLCGPPHLLWSCCFRFSPVCFCRWFCLCRTGLHLSVVICTEHTTVGAASSPQPAVEGAHHSWSPLACEAAVTSTRSSWVRQPRTGCTARAPQPS